MVSIEAPKTEQTAHQPPNSRRVRFELCYSIVFLTVRWRTGPFDTRSAWHRLARGLPFALGSLVLGPWGLPWGPIWTAVAVWTNLTGGTEDDLPGAADAPEPAPSGVGAPRTPTPDGAGSGRSR